MRLFCCEIDINEQLLNQYLCCLGILYWDGTKDTKWTNTTTTTNTHIYIPTHRANHITSLQKQTKNNADTQQTKREIHSQQPNNSQTIPAEQCRTQNGKPHPHTHAQNGKSHVCSKTENGKRELEISHSKNTHAIVCSVPCAVILSLILSTLSVHSTLYGYISRHCNGWLFRDIYISVLVYTGFCPCIVALLHCCVALLSRWWDRSYLYMDTCPQLYIYTYSPRYNSLDGTNR